MTQGISRRPHSSIIWVLVANSEMAHVYQLHRHIRALPTNHSKNHPTFDEHYEYELLAVPDDTVKAEAPTGFKVSRDQQGVEIAHIDWARTSAEAHSDRKGELNKRFAKIIGAKLEKALAAKAFDQLVLAAPAKMIGELRADLPPAVAHHIAAVLPKDLVSYEKSSLLVHLQDTLGEILPDVSDRVFA